MCETNDGTPCPYSKPSAPTKRRTCAQSGCERIASGGAKHCRTCRTEAPLRAEMARRYDAHRRRVEMYRSALGGVALHLLAADITGESPEHAAKLAAEEIVSLRTDRDHAIHKAATWHKSASLIAADAEQKEAAEAERDEAVKALGVSRGIARGQEERLRRAKAERDSATATVRQLTEQVGTLKVEVDESYAERNDWRGVALDNAVDRDKARAEATTLRLRLRIMYAVSALLGVAAVVGGVL